MSKLINVRRATEKLGNETVHQTYGQVYGVHFPPGVIVRIGRVIRFDEERLEEWIAAGGSPLGIQNKPARAEDLAAQAVAA